MRRSKDELLKYILELNNTDELFKLKYQLETQPFCGIEQCYDLERFIFHILTIEQRELIIEHITRISADIEKKIHIFTTYDYFNQCSEKIKYFLKVNSDFITIINNQLVPQKPREKQEGGKKPISYQLFPNKPSFWAFAKKALGKNAPKTFGLARSYFYLWKNYDLVFHSVALVGRGSHLAKSSHRRYQ